MLFNLFLLICLLLTNISIQSTHGASANTIQNLELDDVTSLWDKFPALIDKIKEAVSRFRCPKGWTRLGGSCYYFSNQTSTSFFVNYTCNYLHSNQSNLMQIRNAVELFYAAHVLSRNNLSALMIDIDPALLKGKRIAEILTKDQGVWKRMKASLRDIRLKYQRLKHKVVDRLSVVGLRILRRSKKMKPAPTEEEILQYHMYADAYHEYEDDRRDINSTLFVSSPDITLNLSSIIDPEEYEYDDLDSSDEIDEFEQIEDNHRICDDLHWNVLNETTNATVFLLTKYNMSDKIICSLSDIDPQTKYHHVCEYVLDFCFANILCGKHGQCVNTLTGFQCSCSFLYGGLLCEKISDHGRQIIIGFILIIIMFLLSIKLVRTIIWSIVKLTVPYCRRFCYKCKSESSEDKISTKDIIEPIKIDTDTTIPISERRQTLTEEFVEFFLPRTVNPLLSPTKRNLVRNISVGVLSIVFLSLLFFITTIMYYRSFGYNIFTDEEHITINDTIRLVKECTRISDYRRGNVAFAPIACVLILLFSWTIKRETLCVKACEGRPGLIVPIEPFRTGNRFTTATVFGIIAFEVLKIFEELLFSAGQPLGHGVLVELLMRIALVIIIGLRYYPVLASLQLRNIVARLFACLYIICNIVYTIVREGSCMGFLPLSGKYTELEEAKLRRELGTWFIIYGLIKNIPHFFFLSYIGAELCVRFAYDSVYVPMRKNRSIWSTPIVPLDESEFAKYYVTKLFRRNHSRQSVQTRERKVNLDHLVDYEHEVEQQNRANRSRFQRLINYFYESDDHFRFTTMLMSTYTVAVVFLYYLACTFVFLYITRTNGHVAFLKFYFESTFNVDLGAFSFKNEVILSAVIAGVVYAGQLLIGLKTYKKHKLLSYKGLYFDIPLRKELKADDIASNSVHYPGFLVGYMAWGFVICFHLILLIAILIRVLSLQIRQFELALSIIVPIFVIYLLKLLGITSAGKFLFFQKVDKNLKAHSRKAYALFLYFSFFADCFLGVASCIIRLIKSIVLNIIFMARLDWSFHGRPLEKKDLGFSAYVSYIHMENTYTNPVMLAFCYSLYDDIVQRRPGHSYEDECCFRPGERDDDNDTAPLRQSRVLPNRTDPSQNSATVRYRSAGADNGSKGIPRIKIEEHHSSTELLTGKQPSISSEENRSKTSTVITSVSKQRVAGPAVPPREDLPSGESDDDSLKKTLFPTVGKIVPKPQPRLKSPVESSKTTPENRSENDEDDDDSEYVTDNDSTVQILIPSKQSKTDNRESKGKSLSSNTDDDRAQTSQHSKGSERSRNEKSKKMPNKNHYEMIPLARENLTQETTAVPSPSTHSTDAHPLRSISYCQAQHKTPPLSVHRSLVFSSLPNRKNTNDNSSHYSEITNETTQSSVSNLSYSKTNVMKIPSNHSNKQQIVEEQKHENETDAENQEEEETDSRIENRPLINSIPVQPTANSTTATLDGSEKDEAEAEKKAKEDAEKERIRRRKRSRTRWHLLFTLHNNCHLIDLKNGFPNRLAAMRQERDFRAALITAEILKSTERAVEFAEPLETLEADASTSIDHRRPPPPLARLTSVTVSNIPSDYPPSSPCERYVANRLNMLCDVNNEQLDPSTLPFSVISQQRILPNVIESSTQSFGFTFQPSFESKIESRGEHISHPSTARGLLQRNLSPLEFQPASASNLSTADYPLTGSSVIHSPTYRTQMSHEQQMQAWHQKQMEKMQKKQRHAYVYAESMQSPFQDPINSTVYLTPQIIQPTAPPTTSTLQPTRPPLSFPRTFSVDNTAREPTQSPFRFPGRTRSALPSIPSDTSSTTKAQQSQITRPQQGAPAPPTRMDRLDEDPQEITDAISSSDLIHRRDSQSDTTDKTED